MHTVTVKGPGCPRGVLRVPGDKSISHRVALLAMLADGTSTLDGFLESEDCRNTLFAIQHLGAGVRRDGDRLVIDGTAGRPQAPGTPLDMGNSGTGMRLIAGILAAQPFVSILTGDASLSSRPMRRIADPLRRMGAGIDLTGDRETAPITLRGGGLKAIDYTLPVASAQVKSCVLLAGLFARGQTTVTEPLPTRDHTERLLQMAGVAVNTNGNRLTINGADGPVALKARDWIIPGDFSSAAFWLAAAAVAPDAGLTLENVGLNPRRTAFLDWIRRMGAAIDVLPANDPADRQSEPRGNLRIRGGASLQGTDTGGAEIPNLIDELPLVAVVGALANGETRIRDAAELRVKESDRIAVMAHNLAAMGIEVEEYPDGMRIRGCGGQPPGGCVVDSRGDHRIAMAMAIMALFAEQPVTIRDADCTETSYPGFWQILERMGGHVEPSHCD